MLAGAALTHASLAVLKTARRRTLRLPPWEAIQLFLGLAIPYFLIKHVAATRGLHELFDVDVTYTQELSILWPGSVLSQSALLLIVWAHGCIGLHFWLRIRPGIPRAFPYLLALAVAIPVLALWGWIDAARRLWLLGQNTGYLTPEQFAWVNRTTDIGHAILIVVVATIAGALLAYRLQRSMVKGIQITYPGDLAIRTPPGPTLLEISRMSGIPHASVCGGRARCSTCRTKILKGLEHLEPPDANEIAVLERIGAESDVRLACQIRPREDMVVRPLLPARGSGRAAARAADAYYWGVEQTVAVMFIDIRGFTTLSEQRLSYDIVYVLNRYFDVMTRAIDGAGGYVDKFIGDGIMAIFGMSSGAQMGARQALDAAVRIDAALAALNEELAAQPRCAARHRHRHPCRTGHSRAHRRGGRGTHLRPHHRARRYRQHGEPAGEHVEGLWSASRCLRSGTRPCRFRQSGHRAHGHFRAWAAQIPEGPRLCGPICSCTLFARKRNPFRKD